MTASAVVFKACAAVEKADHNAEASKVRWDKARALPKGSVEVPAKEKS